MIIGLHVTEGHPMHVLLSGIVGSTAYGLNHAGSDLDRLGVFAAPTVDLHGLHQPQESHVSSSPDVTLHEARKAVALMLKANPTVSELLWLPDECYEVRTVLGDELVGLRGALVSARDVRGAYLGYCADQFRKLLSRGDAALSPEVRRRSLKHARHMVRLVETGVELHHTGHLRIRLADPDRVRALAEEIVARPEAGERLIARAESEFDRPGVLPEQPDEAAAEAWLRRVRQEFYAPEPVG
jgi:predicted nucleotidyltransferase